MKNSPIREKVFSFLKKKKGNLSDMSLRDVGEAIGLGKKGSINPQIIAHHLKYLEDKGFIRKESTQKYTVLDKPADDIVYIKFYGVTAQCGPHGLLGDDDVKEEIPLHSKTFGISKSEDFFLIKAKGNSMEPMIHNGDLILARYDQHAEDGQIKIVVHDNEVKAKKIRFGKSGIYLVSLNTDKYPVEESSENDLHFVGTIKSVIRQNLK